jgi:hypothetical protein
LIVGSGYETTRPARERPVRMRVTLLCCWALASRLRDPLAEFG